MAKFVHGKPIAERFWVNKIASENPKCPLCGRLAEWQKFFDVMGIWRGWEAICRECGEFISYRSKEEFEPTSHRHSLSASDITAATLVLRGLRDEDIRTRGLRGFVFGENDDFLMEIGDHKDVPGSGKAVTGPILKGTVSIGDMVTVTGGTTTVVSNLQIESENPLDYDGWLNRDTWLVNAFINNTPSLYYEVYEKSGTWTPETAKKFSESSYLVELELSSLDSVNWYEIAQAWNRMSKKDDDENAYEDEDPWENSFMKPEIEYGRWFQIETHEGLEIVPSEYADDLRESAADPDDPGEFIFGWGVRLSAPGYMDATGWSVFDTEKEATEFIEETYLE